ncbi:MAG: GNAT family N-acetyltransferase [Sulfuriferula sp.]|nr:GNAT family N-acetyltransferase [Sulfuriferula sp.]
MDTRIFIAQSDQEIQNCFPAFKALRPHLSASNFLPQVRRQQAQGYQMLALEHERRIRSAAGFRIAEFLAWGQILYIDDLITLPDQTRHGYGGKLLDWLIAHAHSRQCQGLHLDSGYMRHDAHRLYLHKGFQLSSHHLALKFE